MCKFCNGSAKLLDKNDSGRYREEYMHLTANVTKGGNLSIYGHFTGYGGSCGRYGWDEEGDPNVLYHDFSKRVKINYCPMCGRKL